MPVLGSLVEICTQRSTPFPVQFSKDIIKILVTELKTMRANIYRS